MRVLPSVASRRRVTVPLVLFAALGLVLLCAKKIETPDFGCMLLIVLAIACGIGVLGALSYTIFATSQIVQFFSQAPVMANCFPDVTVLKPLHGDEWQLAAHFEDVLQFMIYIASFCSSSVVWRGTRFRVDRSGMLSPDRET